MAEPVDELAEPVETDPVPDLVENILGAAQYLSPSYWIGWVAEQVTGTNPWVWVAEEFAGDWAAVQRSGVALENLAEFSAGYGVAVRNGMSDLGASWTGHAADAASTYFTEFGDAVEDQASPIRAMGGELRQVAVGMYETANVVRSLWQNLMDMFIAMAASAAAAAASSWTLVGPIFSAAAFAASMLRATSLWRQVLSAHDDAWNASQAVVGLIAGYLGAVNGRNLTELPGTGYDHPGV